MIVSFAPQSAIVEDKMYKFMLKPQPIPPTPFPFSCQEKGKGETNYTVILINYQGDRVEVKISPILNIYKICGAKGIIIT